MSSEEITLYGDKAYWDQRYHDDARLGANYEWYFDYNSLKSKRLLEPFLSRTAGSSTPAILEVGCGNSDLCHALWQEGFTNVTAVDISDVVINQMKEKYPDCGVNFLVMDCRLEIALPSASLDLIIDKGATDTICCDRDGPDNLVQMNLEIFRVLKDGGTYCVFSYGTPETREKFWKKKGLRWTISHESLENHETKYFRYIMTKLPCDQLSQGDTSCRKT